MRDFVNDLLHIAWGVWIIVVVSFLPLWILAPLAVLPREMEQTYHALDDKSWEGLKAHMTKGWALRKARDLAGFFIGGLIILQVV